MPARSVSWASSGEKGCLRLSLMVSGSTTSTLSTGAELGLAERALHGEVAVEAVLGGLGVERLAVMELHAGPELDGDRLAVGRGLVAERQLRHDVRASRRCRTACRRSRRRRCARYRCATASGSSTSGSSPSPMRRWPWAKAPPAGKQATRQSASARTKRRAVCLMFSPSNPPGRASEVSRMGRCMLRASAEFGERTYSIKAY